MICKYYRQSCAVLIGVLAAVSTGCIFFPGLDLTDPLGLIGNVSDNTNPQVGKDLPTLGTGAALVNIINDTNFDAECTVLMFVGNEQVHTAIRQIAAHTNSVFVGPDDTDRITVQARLPGVEGFLQDLATFLLTQDFEAGDVVEFHVEAPQDDVEPNKPAPPPPPPPPVALVVAIAGLNAAVTIEVGDPLDLSVSTSGANATTTFSLFADPDGTPGNGNEITIVTDLSAGGNNAVQWDTSGVPPGTYSIYAEARDADRFVRSATAPGTVTILARITAAFVGLNGDLSRCVGELVSGPRVQIAGALADGTFSIFADPDATPNSGNEIALATGLPISGDDALSDWDTTGVAPGTYSIYVDVADSIRSLRVLAIGRVILVAPPALAFVGLDADVVLDVGDSVAFSVATSNVSAGALLSVFATLDEPNPPPLPVGLPNGADPIPLLVDHHPGDITPIVWDPNGSVQGTYTISATLVEPDAPCAQTIDSAATGQVIVLPPLAISIIGLDSDTTIEPGTPVSFSVATDGTDGAGRFSVFAVSADPNDGAAFEIISEQPVGGITPVQWNTAGVAPGSYRVFARLTDVTHGRSTDSALAPGTVRILPPLTIEFIGLDTDIEVVQSDIVSVDVAISGFDPNALFSVYADVDGDPNTEPEVTIVSAQHAAALNQIDWETTYVTPGSYHIFAEVYDVANNRSQRAWAAGQVIVLAPPTLTILGPSAGHTVPLGEGLIISWFADDPDSDATFHFFLDTDTVYDADEPVLTPPLSEDADPNGTLSSFAPDVPAGTYFVGGMIADEQTTIVVYGPQICYTDRRIGTITPTQLGTGELTTIDGEWISEDFANGRFGAAIDISRDFNGDGRADLLIGDPNAMSMNDGNRPRGVAYYHEPISDVWPTNLSVSDLRLRITGTSWNDRTGDAVAMVDSLEPNQPGAVVGELMIGATRWNAESPPTGAVFLINGKYARNAVTEISLYDAQPPRGSRVRGDTSAPPGPDHLGDSLAALGDVDLQGRTDIAAGAPYYDGRRGRAAIFAGEAGFPHGRLSDLGDPIEGAIWVGIDPNDQAGTAVADAGEMTGDTYADLLVGAPGVGDSAGAVYLIPGDPNMLNNTSRSLAEIGAAAGSGAVFFGESPGDRAGTSIAVANLDGDELPDLLIGAPGANMGAGRVYVIFGSAAASDGLYSLSEVGASIAGVVIDGRAAGDALGASLARAGDHNDDGFEDFIAGAPGVDADTGAAYVIYGDPAFGPLSLDSLDACGAGGFEFLGENPGDECGAAVSGGGDLNGDEHSDVAIGAPGANGRGRVYLLFGTSYPGPAGPCVSDINDDGFVDLTDLGTLLNFLGQVGTGLPGDVNDDGQVDLTDLGILLGEFGHSCPD